jgi:hypothetical protein
MVKSSLPILEILFAKSERYIELVVKEDNFGLVPSQEI